MLKMTFSTEPDVLDIMEPTDVFAVSGPTAPVSDNDLLNVWLAMQHDPTVGHLLEVIQGLREERADVEEMVARLELQDREICDLRSALEDLEIDFERLRERGEADDV